MGFFKDMMSFATNTMKRYDKDYRNGLAKSASLSEEELERIIRDTSMFGPSFGEKAAAAKVLKNRRGY